MAFSLAAANDANNALLETDDHDTAFEGIALVLGSGVAGLTAAAALACSPFARRIIVVDREIEGGRGAPRAYSPQDAQPHLLASGGHEALCSLFPGFGERLVSNGAVKMTRGLGIAAYVPYGRMAPCDDGYEVLSATKPVIDKTLRDLLLEMHGGKVVFKQGTAAEGFTFDADKKRVTGALLSDGSCVGAAVVVDAMGSASPAERWLAPMAGGERVPRVSYTMQLQYASVVVQFPRGAEPEPNFLIVLADHTQGGVSRGGSMVRLTPAAARTVVPDPSLVSDDEGFCAIMAVCGYGKDRPQCASREQWLEYAAGIRHTVLLDIALRGHFITTPRLYARNAQQWRRYDQVSQWPDGLVVAGDAVAVLNPSMGLGMSVAAKTAADVLRKHANALLRAERGFAHRALVDAVPTISFAFEVSWLEDSQLSNHSGDVIPGLALRKAISDAFVFAVVHSAAVSRAIVPTFQFQGPWYAPLRVDVFMRVLYWWIARKMGLVK